MERLDPVLVEIDLAAYYDQEGDERCRRPIEPPRLTAQEGFLLALPPARSVLEIGSGPGRDAGAFIEAGHHYTAVDLSMEHARRCGASGAEVARASVRALPFRAGAFDVVWTMSTLMHVPEGAIEGALDEVGRVIRPGGVAAIGAWGGADVEHHSVNDAERGLPPRLFSRRSNARWLEMLARIGDIEDFCTWAEEEDFFYQWAVVRRP